MLDEEPDHHADREVCKRQTYGSPAVAPTQPQIAARHEHAAHHSDQVDRDQNNGQDTIAYRLCRFFLPRRLIPRIDRLEVSEFAAKRRRLDMSFQFWMSRVRAIPRGAGVVSVQRNERRGRGLKVSHVQTGFTKRN